MKKNYYDWLEVSKQASPETIKTAYKTLVKKYHPDLQESSQKGKSEEILKKINEAYAVLSDSEKRKIYDNSIQDQPKVSKQEKSKISTENIVQKQFKYDIKSKPKKTYEEYKKDFIALIFTIFIILILFNIPFVKKIIINFYNNNSAFQYIIDTLTSFFTK